MGVASVIAYAPKPGNAGCPGGASNHIRHPSQPWGKGKTHKRGHKKEVLEKGGPDGARMQRNDTPLNPWEASP